MHYSVLRRGYHATARKRASADGGFMYRFIQILAIITISFGIFGGDHNAVLEGNNGARINIGQKLGADKKIAAALKEQRDNLQPGISRSVHIATAFHTEDLSMFIPLSKESAEHGVSVSYYPNTRQLRTAEGKETIDELAKTGLGDVYNSSRIHDKMVAIINKKTDGSGSSENLSGTVFLGSCNLGSKNAAERNEECLVELADPASLKAAQKIFQEGYKPYAHAYDGSTVFHTPKKLKQQRDAELKTARVVDSLESPTKLTSTVQTDIAATREQFVQGSEAIFLESMGGFPSFAKSLPDDVLKSIIADHTAIPPYFEKWKALAQKPNVRIAVRVNPSSSHHAKVVGVRKKENDATVDMVEVGSANFTETSAQDFNSTFRTRIKSISPLRERHNKIHQKAQEANSQFVVLSPTGKRLSERMPEERAAKRRRTAHQQAPVADNLAEIAAVATSMSTLMPSTTTTTTTTTTVQPVKRKLF